MNWSFLYILLPVLALFVVLNYFLTRGRTWKKPGPYLINLFVAAVLVLVWLFVQESGGFSWKTDARYWEKFGAVLGALLLVITILLQLSSFRRQQVENKFFELIRYYRDNLQEMEMYNPFYYKDEQGEHGDRIVRGRRVIQLIFEEYAIAFELLKKRENLSACIYLKEEMWGEYVRILNENSGLNIPEEYAADNKRKKEILENYILNDIAYQVTYWGMPLDISTELCNGLQKYFTNVAGCIDKFGQLPAVSHHPNSRWYADQLKRFIKSFGKSNPDERTEFSCLVIGLGPDDHTNCAYPHVLSNYPKDFTKLFSGHQHRLGHFFGHLFHAIKYIDDQPWWLLSEHEKTEYVKSLRAQMSHYEQALLFIYSLSSLGYAWKSIKNKKGFISKYNLIKFLPKSFVGPMKPSDYFPEVDFEYKGEDE